MRAGTVSVLRIPRIPNACHKDAVLHISAKWLDDGWLKAQV